MSKATLALFRDLLSLYMDNYREDENITDYHHLVTIAEDIDARLNNLVK